MKDEWIKEAFDKAIEECDGVTAIAYRIRAFLDENTPAILEKWSNIVGRERATKFAVKLSEDDDFSECVESLAEIFAISGFLLSMYER